MCPAVFYVSWVSWGNNTYLYAREKRFSGECKQHGKHEFMQQKTEKCAENAKEDHNVLITGQCGTGASFLLRYW